MKVRWEKQRDGCWFAYSGKLRIGMCGPYDRGVATCDGRFIWYSIDAIQMKWIGKGSGEVKNISTAKAAIERGWRQWLTAAGLV